MIVTSRCSQRWMMTAGSLTFGSRQWSRQKSKFAAVFCCVPGLSKNNAKTNITFTWRMALEKNWTVWWLCKNQICFSNSRLWRVWYFRRPSQGSQWCLIKQLVEWMEWSLHSCAGHRRGNQGALQLQPDKVPRVGYASNDWLFRAKNHAQWLLTNVDVDEYIFLFRWWSLSNGLGRNSTIFPRGSRQSSQHLFAKDSFYSSGSKQTWNFVHAQSASNGTLRYNSKTDCARWPRRVSIHEVEIFDDTRAVKAGPAVAIVHHHRLPYGVTAWITNILILLRMQLSKIPLFCRVYPCWTQQSNNASGSRDKKIFKNSWRGCRSGVLSRTRNRCCKVRLEKWSIALAMNLIYLVFVCLSLREMYMLHVCILTQRYHWWTFLVRTRHMHLDLLRSFCEPNIMVFFRWL